MAMEAQLDAKRAAVASDADGRFLEPSVSDTEVFQTERDLLSVLHSGKLPQTILNIPAIAALSPDAQAVLARNIRLRRYAANSVVYYQDDSAAAVFIVERGYVRLSHIMEDGSVALYAIIPPGASCGEVGAFDETGYCDTASTIDQTLIYNVDLVWLKRKEPVFDELRTMLAKLIAIRHRAHIEVTRGLYLPNLTARLALAIMRLLDQLGNEIRYKGQIVPVLGPMVTQRDLGAMARGTRENVNKILRIWIDAGLVAVEDRHIIVRNRQGLENLIYSA